MAKHFTACAQWAQTSLNNIDLYPKSPPTHTFSKDETIHDKAKQKICPRLSGATISGRMEQKSCWATAEQNSATSNEFHCVSQAVPKFDMIWCDVITIKG